MSQPIDYRNPGPARRHRIAMLIQKTEAMDFVGLATRFVIGIPLTLIAPFLVASLVLTVFFNFRWSWPLGFVTTFFLFSLAIVPWQMWYERRTKGEFYADAARSHSNPHDASSMGEYRMIQTRATAAAYIELALTGPRLLWEAIDRIRGRAKLDYARINSAAELADELYTAGQGVEIRQLVRPDRPERQLRNLIEFLKVYDWADTSSDGKRVWLSSDVQKKIRAL